MGWVKHPYVPTVVAKLTGQTEGLKVGCRFMADSWLKPKVL